MLVVEAVERGGVAIGVALASDFAVGHDVDAGPFHVADGQYCRVVLRLLEMGLGHAPELAKAGARHDLAQHVAVHQPVRLWVGADDGSLQQGFGHD